MADAVATSVSKRVQQKWSLPVSSASVDLVVRNSLTRDKNKFVPMDGKKVRMYICGPTVYDVSHMGHARTFLSFDIIRRILVNYFGYDVQQAMNITDIDDKIIKRGRQRHLYKTYQASIEDKGEDALSADLIEVVKHHQARLAAETDPDKKKMLEGLSENVNKASHILEDALRSKDTGKIQAARKNIIEASRDMVMDWLDKQHGNDVVQQEIFDELSREYEAEFLKDMNRLNVMPTDILTRVSEYVPEIVEYIKKIIENGYAYQTKDGSVYFDTASFVANPKHYYAKLVPEAYGDKESLVKNMREGEGELSIDKEALLQKKSESDFALWKASKAGEPFWDSPWGKGRPGWHIECSVMSNAIFGSKLDIHGGGFDLKFPHHDNEIAQVEAHYDDAHWVNYFLHCGTLRIQGQKMSKSLKNFITIRQALEKYTPRQLRILFLLHIWTEVLDYSPETMEHALHFEKLTNEFFLLVKDHTRKHFAIDKCKGYAKFEAKELELNEKFVNLKADLHNGLCDSFNTRVAMDKLREIVEITNAYIVSKEQESKVPNVLLLRHIALYMTEILRVFGVIPSSTEIGYPLSSGDGTSGESYEKQVMPFIDAFAKFREEVRKIAMGIKNREILTLCDDVRDVVLPNLGVRLEDRGDTVIKLVDKDTLLQEIEQKKAAELAKQKEKAQKAAELAEKEAAKRIPPEQLFKTGSEATKYSKWDEKGIPTHTAGGEEISKKLRKKLEKLWETQDKNYKQATAAANGTK